MGHFCNGNTCSVLCVRGRCACSKTQRQNCIYDATRRREKYAVLLTSATIRANKLIIRFWSYSWASVSGRMFIGGLFYHKFCWRSVWSAGYSSTDAVWLVTFTRSGALFAGWSLVLYVAIHHHVSDMLQKWQISLTLLERHLMSLQWQQSKQRKADEAAVDDIPTRSPAILPSARTRYSGLSDAF